VAAVNMARLFHHLLENIVDEDTSIVFQLAFFVDVNRMKKKAAISTTI
jgi:hypothetical protein